MTAYLRLEIMRQFRNRDALAWRLGLPATLYVFFRAVFGADGTSEGLPSDTTATVIFAVFASLAAGLYSTAPALAQERATGWLRQLRVTPLPAAATVAGKVAAAMAYALPAIALVAVAAAVSQGVELGLGRWVELTLLLWLATAPFAALGVLIGLTVPNAEPAQSAASAAMIVLWVLGGMLTSPSDLPAALESIADTLPTNAAAELGWAAARGDAIPASAIAVVIAWTAALGALGTVAWRRLGAHAERATVGSVTQARRPAHDYWFAFFGAHSDPRGRLLCVATALTFLAFPLSDLLSGRLSASSEVVAATGLVAFAAAYLRLFWILPSIATERRGEGGALLAAIAVLAVALSIAFGDEWLGLLVYLSIALALALSTRLALVGIAAVAAAAVAIVGELDVAVQVIAFGLILVGVRRLMELVRELEAARAQVAELAVREERLRLSRDMHDLLGHHLSLIALKSQLARKLMRRDAGAAEREVQDIESVARSSLEEARAAVRGLRRASLDAELSAAREALEAAGLEVEVHSAGPFPAGVETLLGFVAREGATNVIRHSEASRCEIVVRRVDDVAELEVHDDGAGGTTAAGESSGLRGLAERMAEAGGTLEAGPADEGGFRLLARVPIATSVGPQREGAFEPVATGR